MDVPSSRNGKAPIISLGGRNIRFHIRAALGIWSLGFRLPGAALPRCVKVRQGDLNASVDKDLRLDAAQKACVKVRQGCDEAASREGTGGFWTTEPLGKMLKFKLRPEWLETLTLKQRKALITFTWDDGLPIDPGEEEKYEAYAMRLLSRA